MTDSALPALASTGGFPGKAHKGSRLPARGCKTLQRLGDTRDSLGIFWGFPRDSLGILWGLPKDSLGALGIRLGFSRDSLGIPWGDFLNSKGSTVSLID